MARKNGAIFVSALFVMALAGCLLAGCSSSSSSSSTSPSSESAQSQSSENSKIEVEVAAEPVDADGKTAFQITTNLPDETVLMLTLKSKDSEYKGQTKVTVSEGSAVSEGFGKDGGSLPPGDYLLTVSMSLPKTQSAAVQAVVGANGENITGQYVEKASIGDANVVSAEFEFTL